VIRQISVTVVFAALVAALIGVLTWPGEAQQRTPATSQSNIVTASTPPVFDQSYTAGMRIIQVPQPGARETPKARYREEVDAIDDDVEPMPSRHQAVKPPQSRRVLPPANEPKRTMLNPPNSLHDGPSPLRPLPRWRGIEKFTELPKQAPAPEADAVAAPIPPLNSAPTETRAHDVPAIDDDTPPPAN
jgi:hypothetical protein